MDDFFKKLRHTWHTFSKKMTAHPLSYGQAYKLLMYILGQALRFGVLVAAKLVLIQVTAGSRISGRDSSATLSTLEGGLRVRHDTES